MKNRTKNIIPAIFAGAALLAANAGATVLFTDDFSASGSGSGFAAASSWSNGTLAGGEITVVNTTSFRPLETSITTATADFWYVANLTVTGTSNGWGGLSFYDGGTEDMFYGSDGATTTWEFDTRGITDTTSTVPNFTGVATLLVAHVTSGSIDMWIDPADTSSEAALGAADASNSTAPITPQAQWTQLRIGTSRTVAVNDMTAATTFGEAIPEPSSALMLLGLMAPAMLLRRRRA